MLDGLKHLVLSQYAGGRVEIYNIKEREMLRGDIGSITIEESDDSSVLKIRFSRLFRAKESFFSSEDWVVLGMMELEFHLRLAFVSEVGYGRSMIVLPLTGDQLTLIPAGH